MGDRAPFLSRLIPEYGGILLTITVVFIAFLVNRYAREKRRNMRHAAVFVIVYWIATAAGFVAQTIGLEAWAPTIQATANLFGIFAAVSSVGVVLFDIFLPAIRVELAPIATDILTGIAYLVATFVVLRHAGVELSGIVATSAVVTGILALSLQATLGNVIGGLALQIDDSIRVGDWIQLENGRQARVRQIRWRHTVLETRDWDTLIVPNANLLGAQFLILGKREGQPLQHRMWVYFNVDFRFSPTEVIATVEAALHGAPIEGVAPEPKPNCVCMDFAREHRDSFSYYAVRYWLTDLAADDPTSSRVRERIFAALKRAGIPLAVPAAHLWVEQDTEERRTRKRQRDADTRLRCVNSVELFKPLQPEELTAVAERLLPAPFAAGEIITRQGAVAHWLYILAEGTVEVRIAAAGDEKAVAEISAPGFFGEMGLMTGEPRRATVVAKTQVSCYRLDKQVFEQIVADRPEMADEISEILAKRNVELQAAREHLDGAARQTRIVEERRKLLATIESFFGLRDDDRRSAEPRKR